MNSTSFDPFDQRRKGLEEAFFKTRDQQLMDKMRNELSAMEEKQKLGHVSGIVEERVLASLVQAGVRAETLAAVSLIPLVEVAWCDGAVSPEEREAVLNAAVSRGIVPASAAYDLLKHWLEQRPDAHIASSWKDYVQEMAKIMPQEEVAKLKKGVMERARHVAEAAGGFLGLATISRHEHEKLDELGKAFEG